eukprot:GHUV01023058.1.p1 GENE.GHUV01023058.1~~GHUV01023058.1.p1  ORF type:complete len:112 (-),score=31.59 GHUV01023058.1:596-931(-)
MLPMTACRKQQQAVISATSTGSQLQRQGLMHKLKCELLHSLDPAISRHPLGCAQLPPLYTLRRLPPDSCGPTANDDTAPLPLLSACRHQQFTNVLLRPTADMPTIDAAARI